MEGARQLVLEYEAGVALHPVFGGEGGAAGVRHDGGGAAIHHICLSRDVHHPAVQGRGQRDLHFVEGAGRHFVAVGVVVVNEDIGQRRAVVWVVI